MRKWFAIVGAGAVVGYAAVYFALSGGPAPEPQAEQPVAAAPQIAEPVALAEVVDVMETDSLLDPQPEQSAGVPFDPTEPLEPQTVVSAAPETAPMPRAVD